MCNTGGLSVLFLLLIVFFFSFKGLDFVVDGGVRVAEPSTVVDMTGTYPKIIRQGKVFIVSFDLCGSTSVNYWKTILRNMLILMFSL